MSYNAPLNVKNFITEEEHKDLLAWAFLCKPYLKPNRTKSRFFRNIDALDYNETVETVSNRILTHYNLKDRKRQKGPLGTILSFNTEGAFIHSHIDVVKGYSHLRFNLFLSVPIKGGLPIYNGKKLDIEERILIPYEADKYVHSSTIVEGLKPRIVLGFGWIFQ